MVCLKRIIRSKYWKENSEKWEEDSKKWKEDSEKKKSIFFQMYVCYFIFLISHSLPPVGKEEEQVFIAKQAKKKKTAIGNFDQ